MRHCRPRSCATANNSRPCPGRETAALRDFKLANVGCGSFTTDAAKPREHVCPLLPESGHRRPKCDPSLCAKCILLILGPDHLPDPQGDGAQGQSHEREPTEGDHGVEYFAKLDANEGTRIWAPLIELAA